MPLTKIKENNLTLAWILLGILALIWGSSFILIKKGVAVYTASQVGSLRIFSAAVFLLPVMFFHLRKVPTDKIPVMFISGLLGNLIPSFLFAAAGTKLNSSVSGILNALTPLFTLVVGALFFSQIITRDKLIGLFIGLAGCVFLIVINAAGKLDFTNYYAILPVIATLCYGVNANLVKRYLNNIPSLQITSVALCSVGVLAGAYFFSTDINFSVVQSSQGLLAMGCIVLLGLMGTAVATVLSNKVIQLAGPVFTASVTYLIPVVALGWGLLDGEKLIGVQYLSMFAIIAGVYMVNRRR
jgi:drug/metabolite transporter (DMT)-like permease